MRQAGLVVLCNRYVACPTASTSWAIGGVLQLEPAVGTVAIPGPQQPHGLQEHACSPNFNQVCNGWCHGLACSPVRVTAALQR